MAESDNPVPTRTLLSTLRGWGESSLPPMGLATLITSLHFRPFARLPMLVFTPMLLLSSYLNVAGFKIDAAGLGAAWSGLYILLAARRRPASLRQKFTARGAVRGVAMGMGAVNAAAGGYVYATGDRKAEVEERRERDRWGIESAREAKK
ncbi:hypothetical protein M406DRAFT_67952 [Cryphonectria parasitica EP155]|uniref:Uncharacterized protein n=1 Tax=Cryphonectria parasitica (strain ATCC 38755 / EP155) TaxID=660469 RepID=A0A9P5CQ02_CRYP1|nr:uncharacterized protein M406DRAFT_67952 [Cryphonectria parasitica EP155]KAF3765515.1 hypothetical protein M406DRAFT_67952 [Cryphonectria parasitica EP155]